MTQPSATFQVDQSVHRPYGFLVGEKLDGKIKALKVSQEPFTATVAWASGEVSEELLGELAIGATPSKVPSVGLA